MISSLLKKIFGSRNDRLLKQYRRTVERINGLEGSMAALSDDALKAKTDEFRKRVADGTTLDDLLPEAFAACREASKRVLGMRHFDVQLIGGMVLHFGKIAEMRTGEGKTLMATLPAYLNALSGKGVHVITVNDYLAQRDAEWMGRLYRFLGLEVGVNLSQMPHSDKQQAYAADITYGTNNEFGFDYLRDNMVHEVSERVQRGLNFGIIDEVDSILIDEARTPLIISGQAEDHTELYQAMNAVPAMLDRQSAEDAPGDYYVDEKAHQVHISDNGFEKAEAVLSQMGLLAAGASLYDAQNISLLHHLNAALRAHVLFHRDQHYVVQKGEVVIVDEFTGRLMSGRRWSDGLHQAVEAKEKVRINAENQTLASITFQNYFRMYGKLSGMTGTADTEAFEFQQIYSLETVVIPTHRSMIRQDLQDQVYRTSDEKYNAILMDIQARHERGQPILVGTTSIENSELLSTMLKGAGLPHEVLNAKQHAREAEIVAQAGRPGAITIATNMAGRGTDIVLGGNVEKQSQFVEADPAFNEATKQQKIAQLKSEWSALHEQVLAAGGLHIIGTERHESRRIDNQLRGRSGRQGDPGSSRFYLSMDDPLLRIFAGDRMKAIMERLKLPEGEPIEAGIVTRSLESAQRKVENRNFDIRKQLLEYDDVANDQRKVIYQQRNEMLESTDIGETITGMRQGLFADMVRDFVPKDSVEEQWDLAGLTKQLKDDWGLDLPLQQLVSERKEVTDEDVVELVTKAVDEHYDAKLAMVNREAFAGFERSIMLQSIDHHWREHLAMLDHLRQGIHLRGYAQKNPKQEYKREAFELFQSLLGRIRQDVTRVLVTVQIQAQEEVVTPEPVAPTNLSYTHAAMDPSLAMGQDDPEAIALALHGGPDQAMDLPEGVAEVRVGPKVGRNDPCPCGSGKKYKQCHGKLN